MFRITAAGAALALTAPVALADDEMGLIKGGLRPVNAHLQNAAPTGEATIAATGEAVRIYLDADGFPEGAHRVALYGFKGGNPEEASCPPFGADENADGVVDIVEARASFGEALLPLNADPLALDFDGEGYPEAAATGELEGRYVMPKRDFDRAFERAHDGPPAFGRRVLVVHGLRDAVELPDSARSMGGMPVWRAMPVACAPLSAEE